MQAASLSARHCRPLKGEAFRLAPEEAAALVLELDPGWSIGPERSALERRFIFRDFAETMAFVNAVAWMAQRENHHPELTVGYNACAVRYSTHDVGGLSENDFICAARIDALMPV
ncbi:MAG: 4a-hydroxytetrahydrobiopterin dehydratase [Pseudomonadota bacterium]